ncbi:MAG: 30S ribosomal protein S16 [Flavobacteriales bacterium]
MPRAGHVPTRISVLYLSIPVDASRASLRSSIRPSHLLVGSKENLIFAPPIQGTTKTNATCQLHPPFRERARKSRPYHHLVVADSRAPRDGKYIERIGATHPNQNPAFIECAPIKAATGCRKVHSRAIPAAPS